MKQMRILDARAVAGALNWRETVEVLRAALLAGVDPDDAPMRTTTPFGAGQLLTMPATYGGVAGVKLVGVAPDNPARGLPRVNGVYALFDAATLAPVAVLDGAALTTLRTPAVSALGVDLVAPATASRLVVFGTGPQAHGHVHAIASVRDIEQVEVVGRDAGRTASLVSQLRHEGFSATAATPDVVRRADVVACCTSARTPVFDAALLPEGAVVVACGSHEPEAREVEAVVARGSVLVESVRAALAEAGDVVLAIEEGALRPEGLVTLAEVVRGQTDARPRLVKTVGMAWQDLVVAEAVVSAR